MDKIKSSKTNRFVAGLLGILIISIPIQATDLIGGIAGSLTITNCLIYGNDAPAQVKLSSSLVNYSAIETATTRTGTGNLSILKTLIYKDANAAFKNSATYFLSSTSNLRNAGSTTSPTNFPLKDINGNDRIYDGTIDIGAVEYSMIHQTVAGEWSTTTGWNIGRIPTTDDIVTIRSNTTVNTPNAVCKSIIAIADNVTLTINPAMQLKVTTKIINTNADKLIVKASETLANGTLIFQDKTIKLFATVEMYSKAKILSPLTTPKIGFLWQYFGIPVRKLLSASPTLDGSYVREYKYNNIGQYKKWDQLVNSSALYSFKGYEISQNAPTTITFKGTLANNDTTISLPISITSGVFEPGQHILSNPYTAAIDIRKLEFTNADKVVYLYNTGTFDQWGSYNYGEATSDEKAYKEGQYLAIPQRVAGGNEGLTDDIPSMSGFLVKATGSNSNIKIKYNDVTTKNVNPQRVTGTDEANTSDLISTRCDLTSENYSDRMWIFTEPGCTKNYDNGWDGPKIMGSTLSPQIYAVEPDGFYQVNSIDDMNNTSIAFQPGIDTEYTLTFTHTNTQNSYAGVYLVDMAEKRTIDITESGTKYVFNSEPIPGALSRFKIYTRPYEKEASANTQLKIFGSQGIVLVDNKGSERGNAILYDTSGRLLQKLSLNAGGITAFPKNLNAGVYIVKAVTKTEERTERLLISGTTK